MTQFNPKDFLEFSKAVLGVTLTYEDAKIRAVLGRCYYAVHLLAREKLRIPPKKGEHGEVYNEIKKRKRTIGKELDYLYLYRVGADYHLITPCNILGFESPQTKVECNLREANECIQRAERAIREIDNLVLP
jgi:hypothetical protein